MSNLAGQWIGNVFGTNAGNAFLEIEDANGKVKGTFRFNDPTTGLVVFDVDGQGDDKLDVKLTPSGWAEGVEIADGTASAVLQPDGALTGRWETGLGTAGTFKMYKQQNMLEPVAKAEQRVPEQVFFHRAEVGAVRLFKHDLERLIQLIAQDFVKGQAVVTYMDRGVQVSKFADAFLRNPPTFPLKSLRISIQEPETSDLNKVINVDLVEDGGSLITTSSPNESWVRGECEMVKASIKGHEQRLVTWYRQYGLWVNNLLVLVLLVATPEIHDWRARAACVAAVYMLLLLLSLVYTKLISNTVVFASDSQPTWWQKARTSIMSWLAAMSASVVASWIIWFFTKSK